MRRDRHSGRSLPGCFRSTLKLRAEVTYDITVRAANPKGSHAARTVSGIVMHITNEIFNLYRFERCSSDDRAMMGEKELLARLVMCMGTECRSVDPYDSTRNR